MATELTLPIHDVAFGGKGVGRTEGKVVFVPYTIPGETARVRLTKDKKKFAEATLLEITAPSSDRVEPPCPYFGRCGGCSYQHMTYERQLTLKAAQVEQTLRRVGRLEHVPMEPIVGAPQPFGYRNRIRVHVAGGVAGFFAAEAYALVDIQKCLLAAPPVNDALRRLRHSALRDGDYSLRAPGGGGPYFEQTNPAVSELLTAYLHQIVRRGQQLLVDAYCGGGLFANQLAPLFETVIGIEENTHAIEAARRAGPEHARFVAGDVASYLADILSSHYAERTTVLLDPPATGLDPRVVDLLLAGAPSEIVYVSCNPATLARDLGALSSAYTLKSVTPFDMFPQTAEIEAVALLTRTGK